MSLTRTDFSLLPGWANDSHSSALPALVRSCARMKTLPVGRLLGAGGMGGAVSDWLPLCAAAGKVGRGDDQAARYFFETWFTPYLATDNGSPQGLFTGYYEAELHGAWTRRGRYQTPIYSPPAGLISADLGRFNDQWKGQSITGRVVGGRLTPLETRAEIEGGALTGKGLELLWVDDPVDAFFLHVQGSGRVAMEDGQVVRLGFAGRNGHAYVSIGRELVNSGAIAKDRVSMGTIRAWLKAHPGQGAKLMARNPSYIFFRVAKGDGPIGAQGVALTPGRSLAVDKRFVPYGLPVWLDTTDPLKGNATLRRLVVAQDTGGAIKGVVRGDLFWGFGAAAGERAGSMKQSGRYFLLIPNSVAP